MTKGKLKAFTIAEVLMSIVISSFAIYLFYQNISVFGKMQADTIQNGLVNTQVYQWSNAIKKDLLLANEVESINLELVIIQPNDTISYSFNEKSVIRESALKGKEGWKYYAALEIVSIEIANINNGFLVHLLNEERDKVFSLNNL